MKIIIFSAQFTLIPLGVTLVNFRGREHKLPTETSPPQKANYSSSGRQ